jgi:hypothetical protein
MKIEIETITPTKAKKMLELNTCNRNVRPGRVNEYANEMTAGRWMETGQGIVFLEDGSVGDGQHRLLAIIQSGVTIKLPVARGVKMQAMGGIDVGAKRTVADHMHLHYGTKNSNVVCSSVAAIYQMAFLNSGAIPVKSGLMIIGLEHYEDEIQTLFSTAKKFTHCRQAWIVGALAFASKHCPSIRMFVESLATGENLNKGDPAHTLRNWLINNNSNQLVKRRKTEAQQIVFNACLAYLNGNSWSKITNGLHGINYFRAKNRRFIDLVSDDVKRLKGSK